jgi:hypothetical protein
MVMIPQDPWNDEVHVPRSKTVDCINDIAADLDVGINNLPDRWEEDYGRITRDAAAAFKGRVLLFWASPQFNPENKTERWQRAYDVNLAAKNLLDQDGYGLLDNFDQIFLTEGYANTEAILIRSYDEILSPGGWESTCRPPSGGGSGGNNPTWTFVQAFPMNNGKRITDLSAGYNSTYYWQNRDPRFYATVAYNGASWRMAGRSDTVQWTYFLNSQEFGLNPSTGFYLRKGSNPAIHYDDVERTPTDWIEIRYAEVLLNLAECANEVGKTDEAYDLLKQIRQRAGIQPGADDMYGLKSGMTIEEMREAVIWERQIELAFENKRYWDLRRRNMFVEDLGPNTPKLNGTRRQGLTIYTNVPVEQVDTIRDQIDINSDDYMQYFTAVPRNLDALYTINYLQPKYNFFAIPQNILDRSLAIEQTNGWANGAFDPYAE